MSKPKSSLRTVEHGQVLHLRFSADEYGKVRKALDRRMEKYRKAPRTTKRPTLTDFVVLAAVRAANEELTGTNTDDNR